MMRYFRYELKKNLLTLGLLTAICAIVYVVATSTSELFYFREQSAYYPGGIVVRDSQISVIYVMLGILCFVVPVLMYSFKMSRRGADAFYSLPVKREKLYLVKTLVGLILVFVPYTVAYVLGVSVICFRENYFDLIWYLPGYFGGIFFGIGIYALSAFAFARANRIVDGVIFMVFWHLLGLLLLAAINEAVYRHSGRPGGLTGETLKAIPAGCFGLFGSKMDSLIRGSGNVTFGAAIFLVPLAYAVAGFALLFLLARRDRGEDAEQNSDSWFGYRLMIPLYTALSIALLGDTFLYIYVAMIAVGAIVLTVVYTRKVLFSWKYWLMIGAGILVGVALNLWVV